MDMNNYGEKGAKESLKDFTSDSGIVEQESSRSLCGITVGTRLTRGEGGGV